VLYSTIYGFGCHKIILVSSTAVLEGEGHTSQNIWTHWGQFTKFDTSKKFLGFETISGQLYLKAIFLS
jgi:hypothetical protein